MDKIKFKKTFGDIAKSRGFIFNYGGWYKESRECILTLDLQKSNFANFYYLNIKIYIQGAFGKHYSISKELIKRDLGNYFRREPFEFRDVLNLETEMDDEFRKSALENFFDKFIIPFTEKALRRSGLKLLIESEQVDTLYPINLDNLQDTYE